MILFKDKSDSRSEAVEQYQGARASEDLTHIVDVGGQRPSRLPYGAGLIIVVPVAIAFWIFVGFLIF